MNWATGAGRKIALALVAIVLIGEFVAASAVALTRDGQNPQPWPRSFAVIGDQYTAGIQNGQVWPTLLAQRTGWSVANFALPDTGFAADGRGGHSFSNQVDRALAADPDVVVIFCGISDSQFSDTRPITVGATDVIDKITMAGKPALVVGPTWYQTPVQNSVRRLSDAVRDVADEAGVPFLDALDPPWLTKDEMTSDLKGPTDEGQSVIADKIAAWLRSEVP